MEITDIIISVLGITFSLLLVTLLVSYLLYRSRRDADNNHKEVSNQGMRGNFRSAPVIFHPVMRIDNNLPGYGNSNPPQYIVPAYHNGNNGNGHNGNDYNGQNGHNGHNGYKGKRPNSHNSNNGSRNGNGHNGNGHSANGHNGQLSFMSWRIPYEKSYDSPYFVPKTDTLKPISWESALEICSDPGLTQV